MSRLLFGRPGAMVLLVSLATVLMTMPGQAAADPAPGGAFDVAETVVVQRGVPNERTLQLAVFSPAMGREIPVTVLLPADRSRPRGTLYLLDGNSGQAESNSWSDPDKGNVAALFANENINVVLPVGGTGTLYTDWIGEHPEFGIVKWETFLTRELPQALEPYLGASGDRAIGGISSGAQGAVMVAQRNPGFYRAVAAYSGCYFTEGVAGTTLTDLTVIGSGGSSQLMWGPAGGPQWKAHDIFANAARLRGTSVYLSSGSGLPGPGEGIPMPPTAMALEAGSNLCTDQLTAALRTNGVPVIRSAQPVGMHLWPFWRSELTRSIPTLRAALGNS